MKRDFYVSMVLILFLIFVVTGQALSAKLLYDDFSGAYIDSQKWMHREFVREVDPSMGKLVSKIGNPASGVYRNRTYFQDPALIHAIECDVTVVATSLDTGTDPISFAAIGGVFYNTRVSGGATGDILASVHIGDRGDGLEAFWQVSEYLDDAHTNQEQKGTGTLIGPGTLNPGTAYTVKIEYNGGNGFVFSVAGMSDFFNGPARQRSAVIPAKGLSTGVNSHGGSGMGYVSALFDDVYINNDPAVYDDFSTAPLDQTKWQNLEIVREISEGRLRLNVQADGSLEEATIRPNNQATAYLEARVLVEGVSQVSPGASGFTRIAGWYYNDSRGPGSGQDYNGNEGDVWVQNRIILDDSGTLTARCQIWRSDTFDPWGPTTTLFNQVFTTSIGFDTEYVLSIEFTGSSFIFKCNEETYQYDVTTAMYPPSEGQLRQLRSRIDADPGESGYMKASFDDVYTDQLCSCDLDGSGEVTPMDALCAFQKYLGICPTACGPCEGVCCDVTMDGDCTPADALEIFKEYLGLPSVCWPSVKIGEIHPFTGPLAQYGEPEHRAALLAIKHLGEVGCAVETVFADSGSDPSAGVEAARRLVEVEDVQVIIGAASSGVTVPIAESVSIPSQITQISYASTSPLISGLPADEEQDFLFRTCPSDALQGVVLAQMAYDAGYRKVSVLYVDNPYGQGLNDVFKESFEALGGTVPASVPHDEAPAVSYATELQQATEGDPEVLAAMSYPIHAMVYLKEAIEGGYISTFLFVDGTKSEDIIDAVGAEALEGMCGTAPGLQETASLEFFNSAYEAEYGEAPPVPFMPNTYDAVILAALAACEAKVAGEGVTSIAIRDHLRAVSGPPGEGVLAGSQGLARALELLRQGDEIDYVGASGDVDFDENGDVTSPIEIWCYEGGGIVSHGLVWP